MITRYEREEYQLDRDLADGLITPEQHREQVKDLYREMRAEAEQSAWDAYERELGNWG